MLEMLERAAVAMERAACLGLGHPSHVVFCPTTNISLIDSKSKQEQEDDGMMVVKLGPL
jgi:hypothetical protein